MKTILLAAAAALAFATPTFAHNGMIHDGCRAGQTFAAGDITVTGAFTRATLPNAKTGGGFMVIENKGADADRLIGASTANAAKSAIHQMKMGGDVMKMNAVADGLEIPAGGSVILEPGGVHVMMMGLDQPLKAGECLALTLTFETAGELPVQLVVGPTGADAAPAAHH